MELDPRLHFVVATAIIVKPSEGGQGRKFLIAKRAAREKAFPNKWTVPGGKLVVHEYKDIPKTTENCWYNIIEWLVRKEVKEEVDLEIGKPAYVTDLTFSRPDGYPVITLSGTSLPPSEKSFRRSRFFERFYDWVQLAVYDFFQCCAISSRCDGR